MNPETNKFERLHTEEELEPSYHQNGKTVSTTAGPVELNDRPLGLQLYRADGTLAPAHWTVMQEGENVVVKNYTFKVVRLGESYLVLEPVGPVTIGEKK